MPLNYVQINLVGDRMTPEQFVYWLHGYFELSDSTEYPYRLSESQVQMIKEHLGKVFNHEPPSQLSPAIKYVHGASC